MKNHRLCRWVSFFRFCVCRGQTLRAAKKQQRAPALLGGALFEKMYPGVTSSQQGMQNSIGLLQLLIAGFIEHIDKMCDQFFPWRQMSGLEKVG